MYNYKLYYLRYEFRPNTVALVEMAKIIKALWLRFSIRGTPQLLHTYKTQDIM